MATNNLAPLRYHCSVDDVFEALIEVSDQGVGLFEHPFFAQLQLWRRDYHISVDLYLFYQGWYRQRWRRLSEVSAHLRDDFRAAEWLRLGPHALDYQTPPHEQSVAEQRATFERIYREIERFAGADHLSSWIRLHYFSEAYELADYWRERQVSTLLLTDKPSVAYRLDAATTARLAEHGVIDYKGLSLRRSHERFERLAEENVGGQNLKHRLRHHLNRHGCLTVFSHESDLSRPPVQETALECLRFMHSSGLQQAMERV